MTHLTDVPRGTFLDFLVPAAVSQLITPVHSEASPVYNWAVPSPIQHRSAHHPRRSIYAMETTGLLIIAAILLTITLVRYWYAIQWNLR